MADVANGTQRVPLVGEQPSPAGRSYAREMRIGTWLMLAGAALVVLGALIRFAPGLFSWFGHLPGDIRIEGDGSRVFIPSTSMIIDSVVLTIALNVVASILRDR